VIIGDFENRGDKSDVQVGDRPAERRGLRDGFAARSRVGEARSKTGPFFPFPDNRAFAMGRASGQGGADVARATAHLVK
jgi:hypothetical protein